MPISQTTDAQKIHICKGFTVMAGCGVKFSERTEFITLLIESIPLLMVGSVFMSMFSGMVSALGTRLTQKKKENLLKKYIFQCCIGNRYGVDTQLNMSFF